MLKFDEAVNGPDKKNGYQTIEKEHERFDENKRFEEVPINEIRPGIKRITSTWSMKKKVVGRYNVRINARRFEQQ